MKQARQLLDEALSLSLDEKLLLVEEIWDSIARLLGMTPRQIAYRIQTMKIRVKQF